ncbi:hypothetical protein C8J48_1928 [Desmospora activa DSM 45169]|uniref:Uncharacterized protein n=1 Tax=Desmospora activa DSM 45169 TaxID=1121389 RepID=A0A2T4ZBT3_9BACL|nr:hypothetical protein C8J48_1928 [Desmospora activa DSM 45169]
MKVKKEGEGDLLFSSLSYFRFLRILYETSRLMQNLHRSSLHSLL